MCLLWPHVWLWAQSSSKWNSSTAIEHEEKACPTIQPDKDTVNIWYERSSIKLKSTRYGRIPDKNGCTKRYLKRKQRKRCKNILNQLSTICFKGWGWAHNIDGKFEFSDDCLKLNQKEFISHGQDNKEGSKSSLYLPWILQQEMRALSWACTFSWCCTLRNSK